MRALRVPVIAALAAAAFLPSVLSASAQASTVAAGATRGALAESSGGMVPAGTKVTASATPAAIPSCANITYPGTAGAIHVQTSSSGYVAWGIYMYNPALDEGPWNVDVYVGSRRVDHKSQDYAPHGSVNPKDARKGAIFHITATHLAVANGKEYGSVPNECVIP
jgi:hypothetical protein